MVTRGLFIWHRVDGGVVVLFPFANVIARLKTPKESELMSFVEIRRPEAYRVARIRFVVA